MILQAFLNAVKTHLGCCAALGINCRPKHHALLEMALKTLAAYMFIFLQMLRKES